MSSILRRIVLTCVCLATSLAAFGQTARFSGQVTDPQNAAIQGVEVEVFNLDTLDKARTTTDNSGSYMVPYLPGGHYRIQVQVPGFAPYTSSALTVTVGQAFIYNVKLSVDSAQSTVSVNSGSEITQVETQNAEISGTVTQQEVTGLQLNGRNFTQLIALVPGVSNQTQQDEAKVGVLGSVAYSVNGGRTEYNSFQVDGAETLNVGINKDHSTLLVYPSVDAIQEIKVLTSNYGAQYPSTGNATTLVTTRSGTNGIHASLYEFIRNEKFNGKGYFDVTNGPPLYRRNDFGGTIGGPIKIPHIYDGKNKSFFFFSEEARIEKSPTAYRQAVPSLAERSGDFSDVCPYEPPGGQDDFPGAGYPDCPQGIGFVNNNFTTLEPLSPTSTAILQTGIIPNPNSYTGCNGGSTPTGSCYLADVSLPTYYREELFRIDHALSDRTQASFRYIHDEWDTTTPIPQFAFVTNSFPTIQNRFYGPGLSLVARVTHTFSPRLLNEFVASYTNSYITLAPKAAPFVSLQRPPQLDQPTCSYAPEGGNCGIGAIFQNGFGGKLPGIIIGGNNAEYGGYGFSVDTSYMPWEHSNPTYSFADNVTRLIGHHSLAFGGQWVIFQRNQLNGPIGAATGDIQGLLTYSNEQSSHTTGNAFADFLLQPTQNDGAINGGYSFGGPASYQQDSAQGRYYQRYQIAEPYIQDDWKVTQRLTINAGLRVSLFGVYHEKNNDAYNWLPTAFNQGLARSLHVANNGQLIDNGSGSAIPIYGKNGAPDPRVINGIVRCGAGSVPNGCMTGHLWNPAPRVGFAWDPLGNGKNSIRAGYGIFFEHGTADEANTGSLEGSAPMVLSMTQLTPLGIGCIGNAAPGCSAAGPGAFPLNVTEIPTKVHWSYVQQWSFSIEHELPRETLVQFAYVGSKGTHLTTEREVNQLIPLLPGTSPFGAHDPLTKQECGNTFAQPIGFDGYHYHLANGATIGPSDPGFINMEAACYGQGTGGNVDPNALREYAPGLGQIYSLENIADSHYNAFQASLRKVSRDLTLGVAYTYSHSIDDASDRSDTTFVNSFDLLSNRSSSNFDQRHLLHFNYIYQLPILQALHSLVDWEGKNPDHNWQSSREPATFGASHLAKTLLDGWQLSGITLFESGIPFTVVNGGSPNGVSFLDNAGVYNGVGSGSYPDKVGSAKGHIPAGGNNSNSFGPLLLNPGAFVAPRGLTFGDAGRNSLNNPHRWNFDAALEKHFALPWEHGDLEFRAEAFNVFNHTQFRIYDPTLGNQPQNTASCYGPSSYSAGDPGGETAPNTTGQPGSTGADPGCLNGSSFLHPVDAHRPRTIQFGMKLNF
ncbi:TonB-dependent receptor [Acidicapsa ligni]|uniref:TonB-dependent receptor n=1 Tax=Acidicapsa ligni TaxID=542300 RepID=UPI0021E06C8A|nr:carboxypeptidase regulatory-like domain-containing protein [Acidicapsa ligni]